MSATVTTDKCVNIVPGGERYCSSVYFPISGPIGDAGMIARVVVPYEEMEVTYDRVVDVSGLNVSIVRSSSSDGQYNTGFADVSVGLFDTEGNVRTFLGRYKLVLDQGTIRIPDCGGAVVVSQGYYFGVRLLCDCTSVYRGGLIVNLDFNLVGHSL